MSLVSFLKSVARHDRILKRRRVLRRGAAQAMFYDELDLVVTLAFRSCLNRDPDDAGRQAYRHALEKGMSVSGLIAALSQSTEAREKDRFFADEGNDETISDGAFIREIGYMLFENAVARPRDLSHFKIWLEGNPNNRISLVQQLVSDQIMRRAEQKGKLFDHEKCWIMGTDEFLTQEKWNSKIAALKPSEIASPPSLSVRPLERRTFEHSGHYRVSMIASMYKGRKYLEAFLENIVSQSIFDQSELIIIDACSPEGEGELISRYMDVYPNIVYRRFDFRIGIYDAWNYAAGIARGDYLTNTNLDDLRRVDSIEIQAASLDRHPMFDVVYQDFLYSFDDTLDFETVARCGFKSELPIVTANNMLEFNSPHNAPMWRKRLHGEIGYFDPSFRSAGDYEFWLRCLKAGKHFLKTNDPHVVYYHNPDGLSTVASTPGVEEARRAWRKHADDLIAHYFFQSRARFTGEIGCEDTLAPEVSDYDLVHKRLLDFAGRERASWHHGRPLNEVL